MTYFACCCIPRAQNNAWHLLDTYSNHSQNGSICPLLLVVFTATDVVQTFMMTSNSQAQAPELVRSPLVTAVLLPSFQSVLKTSCPKVNCDHFFKKTPKFPWPLIMEPQFTSLPCSPVTSSLLKFPTSMAFSTQTFFKISNSNCSLR